MTFKGAVVGCEPTAAGPRGLARWRKSASTMILKEAVRVRGSAPITRFQQTFDLCASLCA